MLFCSPFKGILENPDDGQPDVVDLDVPADRVLTRKKHLRDARADDAHVGVNQVVEEQQEAAAAHAQVGHTHMRGGHRPDLGVALPGRAEQSVDLDLFSGAVGAQERECLPGGLEILEGEAGGALPDLFELALLVSFGLDDDVPQSHGVDELEGFPLRALADAEHGDHRSHSENHTQKSQQRAQLVLEEGFDRLRDFDLDLHSHSHSAAAFG
jgi:hypothetical protein